MITDIISVIASVAAALFALLDWLNQTRTRVFVGTDRMCLNNNPNYFDFDSLKQASICISNIGFKAVTVIDVILSVEKQEFSFNNYRQHNDKINL